MSLELLAQRFVSLGANVAFSPNLPGASGAEYRPALVAETAGELTLVFRCEAPASASAVIDAHVAALDVGGTAVLAAPSFTPEAEECAARFSVTLLPPDLDSWEPVPSPAPEPAPPAAAVGTTGVEADLPPPASEPNDETDYALLLDAAEAPLDEGAPEAPSPVDAGFPDELMAPPEPPAGPEPVVEPEPPLPFTTDKELRDLALSLGHPGEPSPSGEPAPAGMTDEEIDAELRELLDEASHLPATAPTGLPWPKPEHVPLPEAPHRQLTDEEVAEQEVSIWNLEGRLSAARQALEAEVTRETLVLHGPAGAHGLEEETDNPDEDGHGPRSTWLRRLVG